MKIEVLPNGRHVIVADADRIELTRVGYEDVYFAVPIDNGTLFMLLNDTVLDSAESRATLKRITDRLGGIEPAMGELQARVKEVPPGGKPGPQAAAPAPPPPKPEEEPEEATIIIKPKAAPEPPPPPKPSEDIEESTIIVKPKAPPVTPPSKAPTPAKGVPPGPQAGAPPRTPTPAQGGAPLQPKTPTPAKGVVPIQPRTPTPAKVNPPIQPRTPTPASAAPAPAIKSFDPYSDRPVLKVVKTGADQFVIAFGDLCAGLSRAQYEKLHAMCPATTSALFHSLMSELLDGTAKATFRKMISLAGHSKPVLDALNEQVTNLSPSARITGK